MLNKTKALYPTVAIFAAVELILGIFVQTTSGDTCTAVSYAVVVLACLFCTLFAERTRRYAFTQLALVMTVCADLFLVVIKPIYMECAMCFFSVAQLAYAARIHLELGSPRMRRIHLAVRLATALVAVVAVLLVLGDGADFLATITIFYFLNLVENAVFAFLNVRCGWVLPVGLLLFIGCDLFVGFANLDIYFEIERGTFLYKLAHPGFNAAWVFYVPSQALLALSLIKRMKRGCFISA